MSSNGYLQRQKEQLDRYRQAEKETFTQYMVDMFSIVLNDPEVMGKDVFGKKRLRRVMEAVSKTYDQYILALTANPEADYYQTKLDARLAAITGEQDLIPFEMRYDWIKRKDYRPRKK